MISAFCNNDYDDDNDDNDDDDDGDDDDDKGDDDDDDDGDDDGDKGDDGDDGVNIYPKNVRKLFDSLAKQNTDSGAAIIIHSSFHQLIFSIFLN